MNALIVVVQKAPSAFAGVKEERTDISGALSALTLISLILFMLLTAAFSL